VDFINLCLTKIIIVCLFLLFEFLIDLFDSCVYIYRYTYIFIYIGTYTYTCIYICKYIDILLLTVDSGEKCWEKLPFSRNSNELERKREDRGGVICTSIEKRNHIS